MTDKETNRETKGDKGRQIKRQTSRQKKSNKQTKRRQKETNKQTKRRQIQRQKGDKRRQIKRQKETMFMLTAPDIPPVRINAFPLTDKKSTTSQ